MTTIWGYACVIFLMVIDIPFHLKRIFIGLKIQAIVSRNDLDLYIGWTEYAECYLGSVTFIIIHLNDFKVFLSSLVIV